MNIKPENEITIDEIANSIIEECISNDCLKDFFLSMDRKEAIELVKNDIMNNMIQQEIQKDE